MDAVVLARVSTREQEEEGLSIDAQLRRTEEYCQRHDLHIVKTFRVVESSTRGERKQFQELIDLIKAYPSTIALVADTIDRVQRGFKESPMLDELRREGRIEIHFYREGLILNSESRGSDIMRWDFGVITAKSYVLNISDNVRRSNDYKLKNGECIGPVPIGYLNTTNPVTGKKTAIIDKERAYLVKHAFELYANDGYSVRKIAEILKEKGMTNKRPPYTPLSVSQVHSMLLNTFYYGLMYSKKKKEYFPHQYGNIIDEWLFRKCQSVRESRQKKPFKYKGKTFIFRGLIRCSYCGCSVVSDIKKGKYIYLCCTQYKGKCGAIRVREESLTSQISSLFKDLAIPDDVLVDIKDRLHKSQEAKIEYHDDAIQNINREVGTLQKQLDVLLDMRIRQSITNDEYDKKARELKDRQYELNIMEKQHIEADEKYAMTVSYLLDLSSKAYQIFESSKEDRKRQLINFVLSNLELKGENLLYTVKEPFIGVLEANRCSNWLPG